MNRTLHAVVMILTIVFASQAFAGNKPAKSICWIADGPGGLDEAEIVLTTKASGQKVKTSDGTVKYYTLQGTIAHGGLYAIGGTGYIADLVNPEEPIFFGGIAGSMDSTAIIGMELYWTISNNNASIIVDRADGNPAVTYQLSETDCKMLSIVFK